MRTLFLLTSISLVVNFLFAAIAIALARRNDKIEDQLVDMRGMIDRRNSIVLYMRSLAQQLDEDEDHDRLVRASEEGEGHGRSSSV